jgi:hypothetical protein
MKIQTAHMFHVQESVVVLCLHKDRVPTILTKIIANVGIMKIYENLTFQIVTREVPFTETSSNERVMGGR